MTNPLCPGCGLPLRRTGRTLREGEPVYSLRCTNPRCPRSTHTLYIKEGA